MVRQFFVWLHRWAGLLMAGLLIVVGLTGSILAFREELDIWLNPGLLTVVKRSAPLLDGFTLRDKAAALYPEERFDDVPLHIEADRAVRFSHMTGTKVDDNMMARMAEFYLDPYTGEKLGERPVWSGPSLERKNLMSFLYRLHFALASPFSGWYVGDHSLGAFILGVTALVWTIDCFVGMYLTLPLRFRLTGVDSAAGKSWLVRWKPSWLIKRKAGVARLNFDLHRAFGLWTWVMLFVFAWSSVALNLGEVYEPTMKLLFGWSPPAASTQPPAQLTDSPALGFRDAYARGNVLLQREAVQRGLAIDREEFLSFDHDSASYILAARRAGEWTKHGEVTVSFDANNGEMRETSFPGVAPQSTGDWISSWLIWLHVAAVFGLPYQVFVCVLGLVITLLSATGVYIWWKKWRARRLSRERRLRLDAGLTTR